MHADTHTNKNIKQWIWIRLKWDYLPMTCPILVREALVKCVNKLVDILGKTQLEQHCCPRQTASIITDYLLASLAASWGIQDGPRRRNSRSKFYQWKHLSVFSAHQLEIACPGTSSCGKASVSPKVSKWPTRTWPGGHQQLIETQGPLSGTDLQVI